MNPSLQTAPKTRTAAGLFEALDWLIVRAPLLPVEAYRAPPDSPDPRVRAALAVGTEDLLAALERTAPHDRKAPRLRGKLLRYLIRMATRPTPYGLFAGVGLAGWGEATDLELAAAPPRTRARPDMAWLLGLVAALEARPEIRTHLRFVANPAVLVRAGRVFLAERGVSLRATGAVRRALAATRGPITHERLAEALTETPGATREKVTQLIDELWRQGVLLTDLLPPLTTDSPARYVLERLRGIPAAKETAEQLEQLLEELRRWDELPLDRRAAAWPDLGKRAHALHATDDAAVQVDMALALDGRHVHPAVAGEAATAGELLLRLSPFPRGVPQLDAYRNAFEARYGTDREVGLVELLDPQFGLGPPSDHGGWGGVDAERAELRQRTLRTLALDAIRDRRPVVELDDELLGRLENWAPDSGTSPASLDVAIFVVAASAEALDAGDFQVVVGPNLGATAAGRNLGRFADLLGPAARAALELAAVREDGQLWAEAVYLPPRPRSANVAIRPAIREREIVLGTTPGVPYEQVIPLDELVVGVHNGRLRVRWPAKGAYVAVSEGHMLNRMQAPAIVRLLEDITCDGRVQLSGFDWGSAAAFAFLPRVQRGRVVLSLAQWRLERSDVADLADWRARWAVPRHVYLVVGDNRLLLDLDDPAHAEQLHEELRGLEDGRDLLLQEALPGPDDAWLPGPEGRYMAELVVPLMLRPKPVREEALPDTPPPPLPSAAPQVRLRPPGSDWLYLKLYCPEGLEEELIAGPVRGFGEFARAAGMADGWVFVRYADPESHLRLRFHGEPAALLGRLMPQACDWAQELIADYGCRRFCFETYDREIERYGGETGTAAAEAIFAVDSVATAELLALDRAGLPTIDRATLTVLSVDDLLAGLGLDESERLAWYTDHTRLSRADGQEYRERQATLRRLLGRPGALAEEPGGGELAAVLATRRKALDDAAGRLKDLESRGELAHPRTWLCRSYVHLHCNRLLGTSSPVEERAVQLLRRTREGLSRAPVAP